MLTDYIRDQRYRTDHDASYADAGQSVVNLRKTKDAGLNFLSVGVSQAQASSMAVESLLETP